MEEVKSIPSKSESSSIVVCADDDRFFLATSHAALSLLRARGLVVKSFLFLRLNSVAIAEKFCIIYPYLSPGGWNIIGRTSVKLFDTKNFTNPCLFSPGDTIKFKKVNKSELK